MGTPIRIIDVAKRLIAQSGRAIEIVYTGLRPGEKLHEVLFSASEAGEPTAHPLISPVHVPALEPDEVRDGTMALLELGLFAAANDWRRRGRVGPRDPAHVGSPT